MEEVPWSEISIVDPLNNRCLKCSQCKGKRRKVSFGEKKWISTCGGFTLRAIQAPPNQSFTPSPQENRVRKHDEKKLKG